MVYIRLNSPKRDIFVTVHTSLMGLRIVPLLKTYSKLATHTGGLRACPQQHYLTRTVLLYGTFSSVAVPFFYVRREKEIVNAA